MKPVYIFILLSLVLAAAISGCQGNNASEYPLGAGFRFSSYGPPYDPGKEYWSSVGHGMAEKFPEAVPQGIWILGIINGQGTFVNFPTGIEDRTVMDIGVDMNETVLNYFDEQGMQVWLQVEPGMAPVDDLIHAMLNQYGHHPSVIGVGVDVEWYQSYKEPEGKPITDQEAQSWVIAAQSHGSQYRVFLKHWEIDWMPPNYREGLVFIDDSQGFESADEMVAEFKAWADHFAPSPVGFQFGYRSDKVWWREMADPAREIGEQILAVAPNTEGLYWVDFTVFDLFPPE